MAELPSKTVRIRKDLIRIIEDSLGSTPELDRRLGDAINHVLKRGIETLNLTKKKGNNISSRISLPQIRKAV